jgi:uncharacterized membrane protein (UPF0127 family)
LTFRRSLPEGTGLLLVQSGESRSSAAIHMLCVFMPLGVAWLDEARRVVDCRLARPWGMYVPRFPARYVLEGHPSILDEIAVGDVLDFSTDTAD